MSCYEQEGSGTMCLITVATKKRVRDSCTGSGAVVTGTE